MKIELKPIAFAKAWETEASRNILQKPEGNNRQIEIIVQDEYLTALKDLDGFEYIYIIFQFHKSEKENLISNPIWIDKEVGTFATRSPNRPNHLGLSVVKLEKIEGNRLFISNADMIDGTPILDIKPYIPDIDAPTTEVSGWIKDVERF